MGSDEEQQAALLEQYCRQLEQNPTAPPTAGLDAELAEQAQMLRRGLDTPAPTLAYQIRLKAQLESALQGATSAEQAPVMPMLPDIGAGRFSQPAPTKPLRRWFFPRLATAAVAILILAGGWLLVGSLSNNPTPLSADQIIKRAQAVFTDGSIKSLVITQSEEMDLSIPPMGGPNSIPTTARPEVVTNSVPTALWYEAPNRWRTVSSNSIGFSSKGTQFIPDEQIDVSDGTYVWHYDGTVGGTTSNKSAHVELFGREYNPTDSMNRLQFVTTNWQYSVLDSMGQCYTPALRGTDTVAGRATYVIDSGQSHCPPSSSASPASMLNVPSPAFPNGPLASGVSPVARFVIWIDRSNYFMLKYEIYNGNNLSRRVTATTAQFDMPIDQSVFTFTPPPGTSVSDYRPKGAATQTQFDAQMQDLSAKAGFSLFLPSYIPNNLVPRQPNVLPSAPDSGMYLNLEYVPASEANQPIDPMAHGLLIEEQALGASSAHSSDEQSVYVGGRRAWLTHTTYRNGQPVIFLELNRDGNELGLSNATLSSDELIKVANSFTQVPIGVTATPTPISNTLFGLPRLDAMRGKLPFAIFAPPDTPVGLIVEPPVNVHVFNIKNATSYEGVNTVELVYHHPDGSFALSVLSGAKGCCRDADPSQQGEAVTLADGSAAHFLNNPTQQGGPTLWMVKQSSYVELRGLQMSKDQLIALANTLSSTANPYEPSVFATPTLTP